MDTELLVLLVVPLILGLCAIAGGFLLLRRPAGGAPRSNLRIVLSILCFLAAFGGIGVSFAVGACVGLVEVLDRAN